MYNYTEFDRNYFYFCSSLFYFNNQMDAGKAYSLGIREGLITGIGNVALFAIKLWAGIVSSSVALVADAWHTLTDTLSSLIVFLGMKYASRPPDREHPFGHGRAEIIASFIISVLLILVGIHFVETSIEKISSRERASFGTVAIVVTIVSLIVKELMAQYAFWVARKTNISSIKADGWHHRSDAISSLVILVGILLEKQIWWIDGVLGLMVSGIIFYSALFILRKNINDFLGAEPNEEQIQEIKRIATNIYPEGLRLHHFHIHKYGLHNEMTFHIVLPGEMKLSEAGIITRKLFTAIKEELDILATIHIDTESKY